MKHILPLLGLLVAVPAVSASLQETLKSNITNAVAQQEPAPEKTAVPRTAQNPALQGRNGEIRLALQPSLEKNNWRNGEKISFDTFLSRIKQTEADNRTLARITEQKNNVMQKAFYFKGQPEMLFQGKPDYAKELAGKKYIFINESSNHNTASCLEETIRILTVLRKKVAPSANIVLASEFSLVSATNVWPIRFAKNPNPNINTLGIYKQLENAADRLNIDILALDDACYGTQDGTFYSKMGRVWTAFSENHPEMDAIAEGFGAEKTDPDYEVTEKAIFQTFLASSDYGVQLRNRQWASYINAVTPFYDIIVMYGGNAHFSAEGNWDSVAFLLNPREAVSIYLFTEEQLPEEVQAAYDRTDELQKQYKENKPLEDTPEETFPAQADEHEEDLSDSVNWQLDFSKNFYRRYDGHQVRAWRAQHVRNTAAFNRYNQLQNQFDAQLGRGTQHAPDWLDLQVYLNEN
jgi:hypothetical protein